MLITFTVSILSCSDVIVPASSSMSSDTKAIVARQSGLSFGTYTSNRICIGLEAKLRKTPLALNSVCSALFSSWT